MKNTIIIDTLDQSMFIQLSILPLKGHGWYKSSKFPESYK